MVTEILTKYLSHVCVFLEYLPTLKKAQDETWHLAASLESTSGIIKPSHPCSCYSSSIILHWYALRLPKQQMFPSFLTQFDVRRGLQTTIAGAPGHQRRLPDHRRDPWNPPEVNMASKTRSGIARRRLGPKREDGTPKPAPKYLAGLVASPFVGLS